MTATRKTLTTAQYSAFGDLRRFGRLYPPGPRQLVERGTAQGYSRRTLQALVDAGYAQWSPRRDRTWPSIVLTKDERLRDIVADLRQRADRYAVEAEKIRPGDGDPDYMLDGFDDVENDAIATGLDERVADLRHIANQVAEVLGDEIPKGDQS